MSAEGGDVALKQICARVPEDLARRFKAALASEAQTAQEVIERLVTVYVQRFEEGKS